MGFPCLDEPPVISSMSDMEDIDLSDNEKPVESCEFVDDVELHAASSRIQRLRAFTVFLSFPLLR